MSASVQRDFDFQAGVFFQNTFLLNVYSFTLFLDVETESVHEQNVAMERLKYMIYEVLENSVFVFQEEKEIIKKYQDAGIKVCQLPEEPYDQIIGLLLMLKFDSILEGRLKVQDILITSKLSDDVKFKESILVAENTFDNDGWWNDVTPTLEWSGRKKSGKEKIVKLKNIDWKESGLIWQETKSKPKEIVFNIDTEK